MTSELLAYKDRESGAVVRLDHHLKNTARMLLCSKIADIANAYLNTLTIDGSNILAPTLYLSGLLHDIGKASRYYQEDKEALSFLGHEYVSSLILYGTAQSMNKQFLKQACILELASSSIIRHHAAMLTRNPSILIRWWLIENFIRHYRRSIPSPMQVLREATTALIETREDDLAKLLENLFNDSQPVIGELFLDGLAWIKKTPRSSLIGIISQLASPAGASSCLMNREITRFRITRTVMLLSGLLITADLIVASVEGRKKGDYIEKSYVLAWKKDLQLLNGGDRRIIRNDCYSAKTVINIVKDIFGGV